MRYFLSIFVSALIAATVQTAVDAQSSVTTAPNAGSEKSPPKEQSSVTEHSIRINGQAINYKAAAAMMALKNEQDEPIANMFYVAYTETGASNSHRPIVFIYNGGPGGSSAPQHMGAFGPKRVVTPDAEPTPPSPYKLVDNSTGCLLDVADLVFIDPVGAGFSQATGKSKDKDFWGVDEDVKSLAQFIINYVSRNDRWNSPKFLIGESYGTFRNAALVNYLQSHDGMDFNGVVMLSTVLDMGTLSFHTGDDLPYILYLPSYAAAAWYHNVLKDRPADLNRFLTEARQFASSEYAAALMKGSKLDATEKTRVLQKLARFTGLSEDYLTKANLRVNARQFMAELQRPRGLVTGRLDDRFSGAAFDLLGENASYDPLQTAVFGAFVSTFNQYVRNDLKFVSDQTYELLNESAGGQWNWKHAEAHAGFFPGSPNVEADLVHAMVSNPHLKVQVENGLFDLATPFFATEYTMEHLELPDNLRENIMMEYYDAGHMMYLRESDLQKLKTNIASFINSASGEGIRP